MDRLDKLDSKLDKLDEKLDMVDKTLVRNTESLEQHMARTEALEDYVKTELAPIKSHVYLMRYGFKAVMWVFSALAAVAMFGYATYQFFQ